MFSTQQDEETINKINEFFKYFYNLETASRKIVGWNPTGSYGKKGHSKLPITQAHGVFLQARNRGMAQRQNQFRITFFSCKTLGVQTDGLLCKGSLRLMCYSR